MQEAGFLTLVVLLILMGTYLLRLWWLSPSHEQANSLLIVVIYANFLWSLIPAVVAAATREFNVFTFGYDLSVWSRGLWLDVIFFATFIITLKVIGMPLTFERWAVQLRSTASPIRFVTWVMFLGFAIYLLMIGPWTGVGYEGAGRYIQEDLSSSDVTVGGVQVTVYRSVLVPALCVLLFYVPNKYRPKWLFYLGAAAMAYVMIDSIASGARGWVVEVVFAMGICMMVAGKRKKALVYLGGAALFLFIFSAAFLAFRENADAYAGESAFSKAESFFQAYRQDAPSFETAIWVSVYLIRLDSVQDGGILSDQTARSGNFALFRPFVGSLVAWVPRYLWPNKPLPLSIDGTVAGLPWYLVMSYRDEPWNNGSVSVAGVSYWQFGWLGVVFTAIGGAVIFRLLSVIAVRGGVIGLFLLLVFCMMTHFRNPVGIDEALLVFFQLIVPILVLRTVYVRYFAPAKARALKMPQHNPFLREI